MKSLGLIFTIVMMLATTSGLSSQSVLRPPQDQGPQTGGLRMQISAGSSDNSLRGPTAVDVAIQNVGDTDVVLNLGLMLANGKRMFPTAIHVTLTNANGTTGELPFSDQFPAAIAGRIDDFTVALRSGSTYVVRIAFGTLSSTLSAGRYRIDARFDGQGAKFINGDTPGIALLNFWNGSLQSNSFEFDIPGNATGK